jgi:hypothetical protein
MNGQSTIELGAGQEDGGTMKGELIMGLWEELKRRNRLLAYSGLGYLGLFIGLAMLAAVDSTTILGLNRWIKPMKFAISITIFQWTVAWLSAHLEASPGRIRRISVGIVIAMLGEMVPIAGQAARGKISHFNTESVFDGAVFSFMGIIIVINTLLIGYLLYLFFVTPGQISPGYLWGIRLGIVIFLLASVEGGLMSALMSHSIGVADGGPGLPFVNWSTRGGDLRAAHFIGLHALQALPLAGYWLDRLGRRRAWLRPVAWSFGLATAYLILTGLILIQALLGRPVLGSILG